MIWIQLTDRLRWLLVQLCGRGSRHGLTAQLNPAISVRPNPSSGFPSARFIW